MTSKNEEGDKSLYYILFQAYGSTIYKIAYSYVKNEHDAKDIVQDTFVKAIDNIHTLRDKSKFETWLCKIAINLSKSKLENNKKLYFIDSNDKYEYLTSKNNENYFTEDVIITQELNSIIYDQINQLDEKYKSIIYLYYYIGLSYEEISCDLDINIGTVRSRLYRAKAILASRLKENYYIEEGDKFE